MHTSFEAPTTLILVRHAETAWNHEHRFAGHSEVDLSKDAEKQIAELTHALLGEPFTAAYTSPLRRCIATIFPTVEVLNLSLKVELGLREQNLGQWESRSEKEIQQEHPTFVFPLGAYTGEFEVPESETLDLLEKRVHTVLQRIAERHHGETILVATHAGVMWAIQTMLVANKPANPIWATNCMQLRITYNDATFSLM